MHCTQSLPLRGEGGTRSVADEVVPRRTTQCGIARISRLTPTASPKGGSLGLDAYRTALLFLFRLYSLGHDDEPAVRGLVCAGGERQQLVAGCERHTGVVASVLIDERGVFRELRCVVCAGVVVIAETRLVLAEDAGVERRDDLVALLGIDRVEPDVSVLAPERLVLIVHQRAEHAAVLHMVAVDDDVVGRLHVARLGDIQRAAVGVLAIEIGVQIFFGRVRRVHDDVVDGRAVDLQPADGFGIFSHQRLILLQHRAVCGLRARVQQRRDAFHDAPVVPVVNIIPEQSGDARKKHDCADDSDGDFEFVLHGRSPDKEVGSTDRCCPHCILFLRGTSTVSWRPFCA